MTLAPIDITVVIPAYNIAAYIGEALDSAISQNPPFKQIIVIDDGSTDRTREIVAGFDDPRVLYHYQKNEGLGPARNKGIELANGEYLYFMDGDDVLVEGMTREINETINNATTRPDVVLFSAIDFKHLTRETCPSSSYFDWKTTGTFRKGRDALLAALRRNRFPVCAFIYVFAKSVTEKKSPPLRFLNIIHEDEVFTPDLLLNCGVTIISNSVLYRRRIRSGSIMTTPAGIRNVTGYLISAQRWTDRANASVKAEARLYHFQAHHSYSRAILYAARAKLKRKLLEEMVQKYAPGFLRLVMPDHCLSLLSKRLAVYLIEARARIFLQFQNQWFNRRND